MRRVEVIPKTWVGVAPTHPTHNQTDGMSMLHILKDLQFLNLLNSLVMIVELHWSIYVNSLYNMVKLALMIFIN